MKSILKIFIIVFTIATLLNGCSTIGSLEVLNEHPITKQIRQFASTANSTMIVLGANRSSRYMNTPRYNRSYGQIKHFDDIPITPKTLPYKINDALNILETVSY